jgi:hypothetical protein
MTHLLATTTAPIALLDNSLTALSPALQGRLPYLAQLINAPFGFSRLVHLASRILDYFQSPVDRLVEHNQFS